MSPRSQSHFQPPPPIRTSTSGSQKSLSSGARSPASEVASPTTSFGRRGPAAASPTEESFFGAIAGRMRRGRSRSRSRGPTSRQRSRSPIVLPPEHFPPTSNAQSLASTYVQRPQQPRHVSAASQSSITAAKPTRPSLQGPSRRSTSGSDPWRGRHSNDWLFGGFSMTETAKDILHIGRKS